MPPRLGEISLESYRVQVEESKGKVESILGLSNSNLDGAHKELAQLKERSIEIDLLLTRLNDFSSSFPWPDSRPLTEFVVEADSVRTIAVDLQSTLVKEQRNEALDSEAIQLKARLEKELEDTKPQLNLWEGAISTLEGFRDEHSLTDAMEFALDKNRAFIERIFSRIHSPAEFSGLGSKLTSLVRKSDGTEAELSQISTGQRSAFALALFLAQNSQLKAAPPVLLIDDPIAHVDDLYALSFLDYLRDLALTAGRQIFFATANEKLAGLFERKFDFMEEDKFRRFVLERESHSD